MMLFVLAHAIGHLDVFLIFFFFGCVGSLLLRAGFSLVAASGGGVLLIVALRGFLIAVASLVVEHGL